MKASGFVHKYGDNVDTDVIIPARYLNSPDAKELAQHCMEDIDPDFVKNVKQGDIIVANENFGCGSSREHAPISIKASGVSCVIATTFARIFYRNAINVGLPILECKEASQKIETETRLRSTSTQARSLMLQRAKPIRLNRSLSLSRTLSTRAVCSIRSSKRSYTDE